MEIYKFKNVFLKKQELTRLKEKKRGIESLTESNLLKFTFLNCKKLVANLLIFINSVIINFVGALF